MSIGLTGGIVTSVAGIRIAQTAGTDVERVRQDSSSQQLKVDSDAKAASAAGVGKPDGDEHTAEDRDADGRRFWERPVSRAAEEEPTDEPESPHRVKDLSGDSGQALDLVG